MRIKTEYLDRHLRAQIDHLPVKWSWLFLTGIGGSGSWAATGSPTEGTDTGYIDGDAGNLIVSKSSFSLVTEGARFPAEQDDFYTWDDEGARKWTVLQVNGRSDITNTSLSIVLVPHGKQI